MRPPPLVYRERPEHEAREALQSSEGRVVRGYECDVCGQQFEGEPAGSGLFIWARGEEVRYEEPPLCDRCASKVTLGALLRWEDEEEEEG
jgi:hypothetical protein